MSLEARKLSFIQDFLTWSNEEVMDFFAELMNKKKEDIQPMSMEEFRAGIRQALFDGEQDRGMLAHEVRAKYGL